MALLVAAITFSACSSDNDNDNGKSAIVGTWYGADDDYNYEIRFNADGTVVQIATDIEDVNIKERDSGTYQLSGNRLTIRQTKNETWDSDTKKWVVDDTDVDISNFKVSISGNTMKVSPEDPEAGDVSMTYTRK